MAYGTSQRLRPEETAILIIDMQNDFVEKEGGLGRSGKDMDHVLNIVPNISRMVEFCRSNKVFVVFVITIHSEHTDSSIWKDRFGSETIAPLCRPGTWGAEPVKELAPLPSEPVVVKHRYSGMLDTDLPVILRSKGIRKLLVTGNATNVCVDSTVRHAYMMDFLTITLSDCVGTADRELHEPTLRNLALHFGLVKTSDEAMKMFSEGRIAMSAGQ